MQLVERGALSLDEDLRLRVPELTIEQDNDTPLTLRNLMSHRAGLVRESPVGNYFDAASPSLRDTVLSLNGTSYVYPPGTRTKYSNAGIAVVGYVLERLERMPFADYMDQHVLQPLGMASSSYLPNEVVRDRQADGWMWTYDGRRFVAPQFALGTLPAGNLYSSVNDLFHFLQVIFDQGRLAGGQLLKPETLELMMTPQRGEDGTPSAFGIGFHVGELDGHRSVGHGGAVYGFATQLAALPEEQLGVVVIASLDFANGVIDRIGDYALRLMLARRAGTELPQYETTTDVPAERGAQLAGRYASDSEAIELESFDGKLLLRRGVFERHVRDSDGRLVVDDVMGFGPFIERETDGSLRIGSERFQRLPDASPPPAPDRWLGLIGEYGWDHNTLYILEDHGRLVALIEWFLLDPLVELGADEFGFSDEGLYAGERLKFRRDASGKVVDVVAASVVFPRRPTAAAGETFHITPLRPVEQLRAEALAATPPEQPDSLRAPDLVELTSLDPTIKLDIRYGTTNNFMKAVFYDQPRALLQRPAAEALVRAHRRLKQQGYGLLIHDAYRPWYVTKMFWDATPDAMKDFVANPSQGSRHNRGCAVDLTLYDLASGEAVPMVSGYDEFSTRSFPRYPGGTSRQRWHRRLLRQAMEAEGYSVYEYEWWHFDFHEWRQYPILNARQEGG
jgi:D-alanyl-D-alanine dipeptidase/CubicO group peptidase (beta-lactamase class C family)